MSSTGASLSPTAFDRMILTFNLETANGDIRLGVGGTDKACTPIIDPKCSVVYARPGEDRWDEEEAGCRSGQVSGMFAYLLYHDTQSLKCKRKASNQYRHRTHFSLGGRE